MPAKPFQRRTDRRNALEPVFVCGWRAVCGSEAKTISFKKPKVAEFGLTDPRGVLQYGSEYCSSSPGELLMTCSTSEVAVCCSKASSRSAVRCASSRWRSATVSTRSVPFPSGISLHPRTKICVALRSGHPSRSADTQSPCPQRSRIPKLMVGLYGCLRRFGSPKLGPSESNGPRRAAMRRGRAGAAFFHLPTLLS